ncbi:MAG TPA: TadE/TadG family type IV pilus assembly protein [Longimicrobiales bacterium]|nr:TadE/TadG family type IV pilus assembly protein [Longimicrobiales bacterium]
MKCERGSAAVEFALVTPVLLLVLLGMVEFGRAWNARQTVTEAARAGARVAAVAEQASADSARKAVFRVLKGAALDTSKAVITVQGETGNQGTPTTVKVQYSYPFLFLSGASAGNKRSLLLQSSAIMRRE